MSQAVTRSVDMGLRYPVILPGQRFGSKVKVEINLTAVLHATQHFFKSFFYYYYENT